MATVEQIDEQIEEFSRFVKQVPERERACLSLDELYQRWREESIAREDLAAIQQAVTDFENGDRGQPADQAMAKLRSDLAAKFGG
ncbi:hypothetical protein Mal64_21150 [Pseudobythopirellula maris]|uniref:Uncharacterized protein n=1 Tax=Pseudobythopirellula maris TaxID=2527991 RepID=A0A5C5ZMI9_9BACT|nr:hypothetical protein [Pseudobythopirellula maris]TWT88629.1 hypothetical protein Mal64_21150 [Pseudobythopirellula maris]